jgi:hypothetical protein
MFAQPNGIPIDPRCDQHEWKALLKEAGFAKRGCMTHATEPQLPCCSWVSRELAVMDVMGWSSSVMVKHYAHVAAGLRREIADQLNPFFWSANETKNETERS